MSKYPFISIIISNYNGAKLNILQECLESFVKIDYPNCEIILVDNASTDNSIVVAKKSRKKKKIIILKNPQNIYSQGINLGFKKAQGEFIALFNNDIKLKNGYLQKLVLAFKKYPKMAIAQGKLLWYFDHSIVDSVGETMDIYGNPVTLGYQTKDKGLFDKEQEILSATGAACLIKKSALKEVGGYEKEFGIGYEDMDHSLRFRHQGYSIMYIPQAIAFHKRGVTDLSSMVRIQVRMNFNKNRLITMIRNYPLGLLLRSLPVTLIIYLGSMIWEIIAYRNIPLALTRPKAIIWVIQNFFQIAKQRQETRKNATLASDKKSHKLFAKADILGKVKAVVLDKFSLKKIKYALPLTYPAEIRRLIPKNSTILDVGCGDGQLMEWINFDGEFNVVGIDINKVDLEIAKMKTSENKKAIYKELIFGDLTKKISFKNKFDVVLCSQVVEHLEKEKALELIKKIEVLAKKRIIVATINGFFQFDHRVAGKHDIHLSGWSPKEFESLGYKVSGQGLKIIYKPGALKDLFPIFNPIFFALSYILTPILRIFKTPALLLIAHKDV